MLSGYVQVLNHVLFLSGAEPQCSEICWKSPYSVFKVHLCLVQSIEKSGLQDSAQADSAKKFLKSQFQKVFRSCNPDLVPYSRRRRLFKSIRFYAMKLGQMRLKPNTADARISGRWGDAEGEDGCTRQRTAPPALMRRA